MSWCGDPDDLERLAGGLAALAEDVRRQAGLVHGCGGAAGWRGPAAQAFAVALAGDAQQLRRTADELDAAAAAARSHAAAIREALAVLRSTLSVLPGLVRP